MNSNRLTAKRKSDALPRSHARNVVLAGIELTAEQRKAATDKLGKSNYRIIEIKGVRDLAQQIAEKKPEFVFVAPGVLDEEEVRSFRRNNPRCKITITNEKNPLSFTKRVLQQHQKRAPLHLRKKAASQARPGLELYPDRLEKPRDRPRAPGVEALFKAPGDSRKLRVVLPELHDRASGRLDASRIAEYLALPLSKLASAAGAAYGTVHKTPSAESLQPALRPIKRSLEILLDLIGDHRTILAWLNSPHPLLDKQTPIQIIEQGKADELETILENAVAGVPY